MTDFELQGEIDMLLNQNCVKSKNIVDFKFLEDKVLKRLVLGQISRCRFEIKFSKCLVKAKDSTDTEVSVYITKSTKVNEFLEHIKPFRPPHDVEEPSLAFLCKELDKEILSISKELIKKNNHNIIIEEEAKNRVKLFDFLKTYKQKYYKKGSEIREITLCKMYSESQELINQKFRQEFGAKWIDYKKQLKKTGDIIYDEGGCYGLWAFKKEFCMDAIQDEEYNQQWFGKRLFVLKVIDECYYFLSDIEVVGDKYRKKNDISLLCKKNIQRLYKILKK